LEKIGRTRKKEKELFKKYVLKPKDNAWKYFGLFISVFQREEFSFVNC